MGSQCGVRCRHLDAGQRRQFALAFGFAAHVIGEAFRRVLRGHGHAERRHAALEVLRLHHVVERLVEVGDDRRRRLGGRGEADEAAIVEIGESQFLHGRHFGPGRDPLRAGDRQRPHLAAVGERLGLGVERERALHAACRHVARGLAGAVEGHAGDCVLASALSCASAMAGDVAGPDVPKLILFGLALASASNSSSVL